MTWVISLCSMSRFATRFSLSIVSVNPAVAAPAGTFQYELFHEKQQGEPLSGAGSKF
jgi:hypothetical protein